MNTPTSRKLSEQSLIEDKDYRKYLIRSRIIKGVVVVLTSLVLVVGVLGCVWLAEYHEATLQYKLKLHGFGAEETTEEVFTDVADNIVQYHVTSNESQYWILKDFNRRLKVTKVVEGGQSKCLVSVLDEINSVHPEDIKAPDSLEIHKRSKRYSNAVEVTSVSDSPVTDRALLGRAASKLCSGAPLYWEHLLCFATPNHKDSDDVHHARHKRLSTYCGRCACDHTVCITCGGLTQRFYIEGGKLQCAYTFNYATCPAGDYEDYYFVAECPDLPARSNNAISTSNEDLKYREFPPLGL